MTSWPWFSGRTLHLLSLMALNVFRVCVYIELCLRYSLSQLLWPTWIQHFRPCWSLCCAFVVHYRSQKHDLPIYPSQQQVQHVTHRSRVNWDSHITACAFPSHRHSRIGFLLSQSSLTSQLERLSVFKVACSDENWTGDNATLNFEWLVHERFSRVYI